MTTEGGPALRLEAVVLAGGAGTRFSAALVPALRAATGDEGAREARAARWYGQGWDVAPG